MGSAGQPAGVGIKKEKKKWPWCLCGSSGSFLNFEEHSRDMGREVTGGDWRSLWDAFGCGNDELGCVVRY